jgi:hypothetical protein
MGTNILEEPATSTPPPPNFNNVNAVSNRPTYLCDIPMYEIFPWQFYLCPLLYFNFIYLFAFLEATEIWNYWTNLNKLNAVLKFTIYMINWNEANLGTSTDQKLYGRFGWCWMIKGTKYCKKERKFTSSKQSM